jgi:hypothetical protein
MKSIAEFLCAAAVAAVLTGCSSGIEIDDGSGLQSIRIHDGSVALHKNGAPEADITVAGDLSIDGKPIAVTPNQRDLLKQYYAQVLLVRNAGLETGKAGAAMAGHALGTVASGLIHGNPASIGPAVDAQARKIEAKAMDVCNDFEVLGLKQNAVANALPAFKAYASIADQKDADCRAHKHG